MAIYQDFSDWAEVQKSYGLDLIRESGLIETSVTPPQIKLSSSLDETLKDWSRHTIKGSIGWIIFGVGIECLLKAVLLKHECLPIKKKDLAAKEAQATDPAVKNVYSGFQSWQAIAKRNTWLDGEFSQLNINYAWEMNTQTFGALSGGPSNDLETKGKIDSAENQKLREFIGLFADVRRNVDAHMFLKIKVFKNVNGDLENVYVPLIQFLFDVYDRI